MPVPGILSVRFIREFRDAEEIKNTIVSISHTNRDHHLIFSQIGETVGQTVGMTDFFEVL